MAYFSVPRSVSHFPLFLFPWKHFYYPLSPKETLYQLEVTPHLTLSLSLANLISFSVDLPSLDISFKLNGTIRGFLCLAFFSWHNVLEAHPYCSISQYFIPFYCRINYVFWLHYILFIQKSVKGHLGFLNTIINEVVFLI